MNCKSPLFARPWRVSHPPQFAGDTILKGSPDFFPVKHWKGWQRNSYNYKQGKNIKGFPQLVSMYTLCIHAFRTTCRFKFLEAWNKTLLHLGCCSWQTDKQPACVVPLNPSHTEHMELLRRRDCSAGFVEFLVENAHSLNLMNFFGCGFCFVSFFSFVLFCLCFGVLFGFVFNNKCFYSKEEWPAGNSMWSSLY